jgi:hypothetical protein
MKLLIDYKDQTKDFFVNFKTLNGNTLNPKSNITSKHVNKVDVEEVFGQVAKFKTTNHKLHEEMKKSLLFCMLKFMGHQM